MSRNGISSFKSERLEQIMMVRRQTQAQLAAMVGVSAATFSNWKKGKHSPDIPMLKRLAEVLNVTPEWFTRPLVTEVEPPLFRSNASALKQAREMLKGRLGWAQEIVLVLAEYLDFPELILPERDFTDPLCISFNDIEDAALEFRKVMQLGAGPIQDLLLAVEGAGAIVIREMTDVNSIEGLSSWSQQLGRPLILLAADKDNGFRSRFDLAHELGHLILHKNIEQNLRHTNHKIMEKQAHAFAGALLLPAETFAVRTQIPPTLDDLLVQKNYWGVSVAAQIMRLKALELIDEDESLNLFKRKSARWGAKSEPNDSDRKPEHPKLLKRSIELLLSENIFSIENLEGLFGIGKRDIENLLGLSAGYLEKKSPKVIPFIKIKA